jgi:hypothetical protein
MKNLLFGLLALGVLNLTSCAGGGNKPAEGAATEQPATDAQPTTEPQPTTDPAPPTDTPPADGGEKKDEKAGAAKEEKK